MTEARIKVIDDHFRFAALLSATGQLAAVEDLEKFGDIVPDCSGQKLHEYWKREVLPISHVLCCLIIQFVKYVRALPLGEFGEEVHFRAHNDQVWGDVEFGRCFAQLW